MKATHGQPTQQAIQSVIQALNMGQFKHAETEARQLVKKYPKAFVGYNLLGNAFAAQNQTKLAVNAFRKAIEIDSTIPEMHFNIAILLTQIGRIDEAISAYRKTIRLNSQLTDAHYNLGHALQSQGQYAEAVKAYQDAIRQQPGFFEAITNLGVCLQTLGKSEEAESAYRQALTLNQDAKVYFNLGTVLKNQGKLADAIAAYNAALRLNADYAEAHSNIGEALRDQGRYEASVQAYKTALKIDPDLPIANYSLAVYLSDSGNLSEALHYFQRSKYADWQERMLYCLYKTSQFDDFKSGLDALKKARHNSPFLATLAEHYAENFGAKNDYQFCPNPLDFVFHGSIPELKNDSPLLQTLLADIEKADIEEKQQGRLHEGVQSAGNLFTRPEASFQQVGKLVAAAIDRYRQTYQRERCVFVKNFPKKTVVASSWYVKMRRGGHLTSHIHEEGWLSGSLYLALPKQKQQAQEGSIELSTHGDNYPKRHDDFPVKTITPEVGDIVMFPSSVFHRTIPFESDESRICIAFDLKPTT
ncbi:TPR repeat protein [Methylophaga frappieri]|uniref:TPR repeat protein n=1 Tax=Methylophaga frappieri (strain ATCC BAA-2434 / DSM 25690 / JAM7) TaxID=754477 RepID=I1YEK3_METFJ|nr:tetratricopeptide repeat protein [Methylophaga frappieri]AFJ01346.1 TPR repeat protein [Methylophaga frappieri]